MWKLWLGLALTSCAQNGTPPEIVLPDLDEDQDGWPASLDCDDLQAAVHPEAHDPWYDGVDSDCAGNDDYDLDRDGHASDQYGGDDCNDLDPLVSPTAGEVAYDGVDQDCDPTTPDDDLDQDGAKLAEDCDDQNPQRFTGAAETIDDGIDQDCNGDPNTAEWGFADLTFLDPRTPHLAQTKEWIVLGLTAGDIQSPTYFPDQTIFNVGVLLAFPPLATNGAAPITAPELWYQSDTDPPGDSDVVAIGDTAYVGTVYFNTENFFGYLQVRPLTFLSSASGWSAGNPEYAFHPLVTWDRVDLAKDDAETIWMCASDLDSVATMEVDGPASPSSSLSGVDGSGGCWSHGSADVTACDAKGACTDYAGDPLAPAATQPWSSDTFVSVRERDGLVAAAAASGGVVRIEGTSRTTLLDAYVFSDAEIAIYGAETWLLGVTDRGSGPELLLATQVGLTVTERWLTVTDGARVLGPLAGSLLVTDQRVILAVSALDIDGTGRDRVGWMLLKR